MAVETKRLVPPDTHAGVSAGASAHADALRRVIAQVIERRMGGAHVPDKDVVAEHPHLMPDLASELQLLRRIDQARLAADTAGPDDDVAASDTTTSALGGLHILGYGIVREINGGGQGRVFEAIKESTGQRVAIKVLSGGPFVHRRNKTRFDNEIRVLASLTHPNIVRMIDRGRTKDGSFFFVMDYVHGLPLDQYCTAKLGTDQRFQSLLKIYRTLAETVDQAHCQHVVHRDLKPSNILVDVDGVVHVLDFGLAHLLPAFSSQANASITQTGPAQLVGSLPWASPEQAMGTAKKIDARSDIYSLGVLLYQSLTGQFPYSVDCAFKQVLDNICNVVPRRPSEILQSTFARLTTNKSEVDALDAIVLKALAKLPEQRHQSAGGLARI